MRGGRIDSVDFVKAAAIVAVAFTHAGVGFWSPHYSQWDVWLCAVWVNYQVPAFLLLSGFLYQRDAPVPAAAVRGRLARILVPYLVASGFAHALGFATADSLRALAFQLVTGSSLGIYYFIFLLALFIPTTWLLSRMRGAHLGLLCAALWATAAGIEAYTHLVLIDRSAAPTLKGLFWLIRSPLNYTYAMFVTGWIAGQRREALAAWSARHGRRLTAASVAAIAAFWLLAAVLPSATFGAARMLYTLAVVALVARLTARRAASPAIRFLSDTSLGLYLYHHMMQLALAPHVVGWPAPLRIGTVALAGLGGAVLLCLLGRRVLGARSRMLLGA